MGTYPNMKYFRYSWFYFNECPNRTIPPFVTKSFPNLETLTIEGINLTNVPKDLTLLKRLKHLGLYMCSLPTFPKQTLEIPTLIELNLSCNDFTNVPNDIDRLTNLEVLKFEGGACGATPIDQVPESIGNLKKLRFLNFGYTEKGLNLPSSFYNLSNLEYFECHGCGLKNLTDDLTKLKKLEYLQLTNMSTFAPLPESLFSLPNMKRFRFYQYGQKVPGLIEQKEKVEAWGQQLEYFEFDIATEK